MPGQPVGTAKKLSEWSFQETYIERLMDDAAFTAAHPNNTMVLAGPARVPKGGDGQGLDSVCLPLGMVSSLSVSSNKPLQPMQALGSGRTFFLTGKGQVNFNIARLVVNGRNLLRALYTNAVKAGISVEKFGDSPVPSQGGSVTDSNFLNLDSELFYIPIGLAVIYKSVTQDTIGAFYIELAMLNSWSISYQAGGNMIMENVSGMADRITPLDLTDYSTVKDYVDSTTIIDKVLNQGPQVAADLLDIAGR
jgi:hypothetical protein